MAASPPPKAGGTGPAAPSGPPAPRHSASPSPDRAPAKLLAGQIVGIDPGHNGLNHTDPAYLDRQIWNGREWGALDAAIVRFLTGRR
jgi:N-acetylmuramoyl-L-alanine amidase